jgi:hypothetical protein
VRDGRHAKEYAGGWKNDCRHVREGPNREGSGSRYSLTLFVQVVCSWHLMSLGASEEVRHASQNADLACPFLY